jgi:hypothetical protein
MVGQRKGNILYEILILILVAVLLATILYPSKVWKDEDESQKVCRIRMESIQDMELRYISKASTYSNDISEVVKTVISDPGTKAVFDTLLFWDGMVTKKELKHLVFQKSFPEDLRSLILEKIKSGEPIHNLGKWDSLQVRLLGLFKESLASADPSSKAALDKSVAWPLVFEEDAFRAIINTAGIPVSVKNRILAEIRRGKPVYETTGWRQLRPVMIDSMKKVILMAERTDVTIKDEQGLWEEKKKKEWSEEMDKTAPEWRDSLWQTLKEKFWESEKEVLWKKVRKDLWRAEQATWMQENEAMWNRIVSQNWEAERKKVWEVQDAKTLADSALAQFTVKKDSLWKGTLEELRSKEYDAWKKKNQKFINETILNLWERERRISWFDESYKPYTEQKTNNMDALWIQMKDELWSIQKIRLWQNEEVKLENKTSAWKRLDSSVLWAGVIPSERIESLIKNLRLPDKNGVWKSITSAKNIKGSVLYNMGLEGLLGKSLIDSVSICPLSHTPYLVHVVDTTVVKFFGISCPINDSTITKFALKIDPITKDTTKVDLKLPVLKSIFGGGSITNHGNIDEEGKKSWEKRGG